MAEEPEVYRVNDVAKLLRKTPWTIRQWIGKGELKAHKVGREWVIRREEVSRLLGRPSEDLSLLGFINEQIEQPGTN